MVMVNGVKFSCAPCIRGHRSANCVHPDRPLTEIRKKGRPPTQCLHCRELRKTKQIHAKCICPKEDERPLIVLPNGVDGAQQLQSSESVTPPQHQASSSSSMMAESHLKPLQMLDQEQFAVPGRALSRRSSSARSIGTSRSYASSQSESHHHQQQHELVHGTVPHHNSAFSPYAAPHAHGPRIARTASTSSSRSHRTESSLAPDLATPAATPQMVPSTDLSADIEALFQQFDPSALRQALEATATPNTANEVWISGQRIPVSTHNPPLSSYVEPPPQQPVSMSISTTPLPPAMAPLPVKTELVDLHDSFHADADLDDDIAKWASNLGEFDWSSFSIASHNPLARVSPPGDRSSPALSSPGLHSSISNRSSVSDNDQFSLVRSESVLGGSVSEQVSGQDDYISDNARLDPDRERIPLFYTKTVTSSIDDSNASHVELDPARERIPIWQTKTVTVSNSTGAFDQDDGDGDDDDDEEEEDDEGREFYDKDNPGRYAENSDEDEEEEYDEEEYEESDDNRYHPDGTSPWQHTDAERAPAHIRSFSNMMDQMRDYAASTASSSSIASLDDFEFSASNSVVGEDASMSNADDTFDLAFSVTGTQHAIETELGTRQASLDQDVFNQGTTGERRLDADFMETVKEFDRFEVSSSSASSTHG